MHLQDLLIETQILLARTRAILFNSNRHTINKAFLHAKKNSQISNRKFHNQISIWKEIWRKRYTAAALLNERTHANISIYLFYIVGHHSLKCKVIVSAHSVDGRATKGLLFATGLSVFVCKAPIFQRE